MKSFKQIDAMKTYVLTLSWNFPATHKRKGESTGFVGKIITRKKIHTIRANYQLWEKRIKEIQDEKAMLSLRYWDGLPYRSKQSEFMHLTGDMVGIQKLTFDKDMDGCASLKFFQIDGKHATLEELAHNDGLTIEDWREWFRNYDLSKPMAIIHFTKFRY